MTKVINDIHQMKGRQESIATVLDVLKQYADVYLYSGTSIIQTPLAIALMLAYRISEIV